MITVKQWESGKVKLKDEIYVPIFKRPESTVDDLLANRLMAYRGTETGTYLEPGFIDILEAD